MGEKGGQELDIDSDSALSLSQFRPTFPNPYVVKFQITDCRALTLTVADGKSWDCPSFKTDLTLDTGLSLNAGDCSNYLAHMG